MFNSNMMASGVNDSSGSSYGDQGNSSPESESTPSSQSAAENAAGMNANANWQEMGAYGYSGDACAAEKATGFQPSVNANPISSRTQILRSVERDTKRLNAFMTAILKATDENGAFVDNLFQKDGWDFLVDSLFQFVWNQSTNVLDTLFQVAKDGYVENTYAHESPGIGKLNLHYANELDNCAIDSMYFCKSAYSQITGSSPNRRFGSTDSNNKPKSFGNCTEPFRENGNSNRSAGLMQQPAPPHGGFPPMRRFEDNFQVQPSAMQPILRGPMPAVEEQMMIPPGMPINAIPQPEQVQMPQFMPPLPLPLPLPLPMPSNKPGPCVTHTIPVVLLQGLENDQVRDPNSCPPLTRRIGWFVPPSDGLLGPYPNAPFYHPPILLPPGLMPASGNPDVVGNGAGIPAHLLPIASTCASCARKLEKNSPFVAIPHANEFDPNQTNPIQIQPEPLPLREFIPFPVGLFQNSPNYRRAEHMGSLMSHHMFDNTFSDELTCPHICYRCGLFGAPGGLQNGFPMYPVFR